MLNLISEALHEHGVELSSSSICILGYAFLENSDDTRNTPAQPLYELLRSQCRTVTIHDPHTQTNNVTNDLTEALTDANCLALVTAHKEYHELDLDWLKETMKTPIIVDGRYVFNPKECREKGFTYRGVGIGKDK
jgi:UDP-N-acetyl-D-mannosaminuronic acid dehydrogenase